uniref:CRISPR-associated protein n=1 Tax=viral metagenome TaxID=1070528 RepID=A0A6H1ZJ14_9ZZZZ
MSEPLRVEIRMATPIVVPSHIKCFDGLLAWARVEQAIADGVPVPDCYAFQNELPLEKYEADGQWVFKASTFRYEWGGERFETHRIKRQRVGDYAESWMRSAIASSRKGRIRVDTTSGATKAGLYPLALRQCEVATAWCVGDRESVERLMRHVVTFGKGRNRGTGIVRSVTVCRDEQALKLWDRRPMPASYGEGVVERYAPGAHPLQAPYWDTRKTEVCMLPLRGGAGDFFA